MAYIPKDARWYLADVVLEMTVEGDPRNVVHVNVHLIEADSPERAYEKANVLGHEAEQDYTNSDGRAVHIAFRGLRDLNVIHDGLVDGAELTYEESIAVREAELAGWVRPKGTLSVFARGETGLKRDVPNYMPQLIMDRLLEAGFTRDDLERGEPDGDADRFDSPLA